MRSPRLQLALVLALLTLALMSSVADTVGQKQQQLQGLNGQIVAAKTEIAQLLAQERALQIQVAQLDAQLRAVQAQIDQETAKLAELTQQVAQAKQQLADKEAELAQHIAQFGERMRIMYKSGQVSGLELVFSAVNFTDLLNRAFFFNDIVREDRRQVAELQKERAAIEALKADLEAKQAQQVQVVKQIQDQKVQLQGVRDQIAAHQAQIAAIEARFQQQLAEMEAQRAALQAQIAALVSESFRARSSGRWKWPIDGVITQGFGCTSYPFEPYDPSCPTLHFHSGIDIANDYGTPVHAADGGIVHDYSMGCSYGGGLCGYGHYVIIVHAGGFISLYGHLSSYAVADGTQVDKDTVIGYEGSTGNSTGPHLHFEIDLGGTPVDPLAYLPAS
ncbi:MAG TPA: peptidoglycan DD-metalloendopeptidase family protein [Candidatus Dormibacteraeota bacterium]|nr:peptidoglycan DD-metalloendopeptidase family protein [Candidatus Dormibacteraeota bacterium]